MYIYIYIERERERERDRGDIVGLIYRFIYNLSIMIIEQDKIFI